MKVVLSRKGFDSTYGGVPSPIFPDGSLLSIPIPDTEKSSPAFSRVAVSKDGLSLSRIVSDLGGLSPDIPAHVDPDILKGALPRTPSWRPAFGQTGAAAAHLANQGVEIGDIFLFFGLFRRVSLGSETLRFVKDSPPTHAIFGWLQIGEIVPCGTRLERKRAARSWPEHPHVLADRGPASVLYVAADRLDLKYSQVERNKNLPGAGLFGSFVDGGLLQLTRPNARLSDWRLPVSVATVSGRPPQVSYHSRRPFERRGKWFEFQAAPRGQEFVVSEAPHAWLSDLFAGHTNRPSPGETQA